MLLGLLLVIGGGLFVDSLPPVKEPQKSHKVFKKAVQINNPNWKMDMLIDSINRRMEHGDATLIRCPKKSCLDVSELKEVL